MWQVPYVSPVTSCLQWYYGATMTFTVPCKCSDYIKEIIWMGTAGYSPQQGGVIDTLRGCDAANPSTAITREGDLCITPWAINWDCKLTDWNDQCAGFPNVCRCYAV